jgi:PHP family Zn ribbon phosphoesterase
MALDPTVPIAYDGTDCPRCASANITEGEDAKMTCNDCGGVWLCP